MQDRKILLHLTRNLLCSVHPEFEPSSVVGFLFCCLDTSCLSCLISFFETYSSRFFNFLAIPCMIFLEEPISQFQLSIQANFVPFSLICPSTCSMQLKSLRLKFLIEISKSNFRISRFPISRLNLSLSFIQEVVVRNVSHCTRTILCISRQSRIAAWQSPGTQNRRSWNRNVGRSRTGRGPKGS